MEIGLYTHAVNCKGLVETANEERLEDQQKQIKRVGTLIINPNYKIKKKKH